MDLQLEQTQTSVIAAGYGPPGALDRARSARAASYGLTEVTQYGVSGVGGVLKRALTSHRRPATNAAVVGTSTPAGCRSSTTVPDSRSPDSRIARTSPSWLRTTYS